MNKKIKYVIFLILLNPLITYANVTKTNNIELLWSKQENYLEILKNTKKELEKINQKLDICNNAVIAEKSDDKFQSYILATNEYSANVLTRLIILNRAISSIEYKMKNDRKSVENNLLKFSDSLDDLLVKEKEENKILINNLNKGVFEIEGVFCKK